MFHVRSIYEYSYICIIPRIKLSNRQVGENIVHLLQEKLAILVEEEDAEGTMQNTPRRARNKPVRQVLVYVPHNLVVLVQRDYLCSCTSGAEFISMHNRRGNSSFTCWLIYAYMDT